MAFLSKYKIKIILIIIIAIVTIFISYQSKPKLKLDINRQYLVSNVIDGDTFEIKSDNKILKIRMMGVDTPETVDPRKTVQCFGKEASDKTKELLLNKNINIEIDKSQSVYDKYGRILAYVKREDGLSINRYLVENGYAHEYTYKIPYKYQKEFKKLEKDAREGKLGLWGSLCSEK
jgi:micrococcal nuclease